jgi:hypothetical protein
MMGREFGFDIDAASYDVSPAMKSVKAAGIEFYRENGYQGDDQIAEQLLADASAFKGATEQGWKFRLMQGEILTRAKAAAPGFFEKWLQLHWPQMGRTTAYRLMATWQHREQLTPFVDESDRIPREGYTLPIQAIDTIAEGGAMPEVIEQVRQRLEQNIAVTPQAVADLNREAKAKRKGTAAPRKPQPAEALALSIIRKGEVERLRQALQLAEQAATVTAEQVMAEQRLRDLGKLRHIPGTDADFHRLKDGSWVRLPHVAEPGVIEPAPEAEPAAVEPEAAPTPVSVGREMRVADAAQVMGFPTSHSLGTRLTPSALTRNGPPRRNGFVAHPSHKRGYCVVTKTEPAGLFDESP